jgi:hypothetical protein
VGLRLNPKLGIRRNYIDMGSQFFSEPTIAEIWFMASLIMKSCLYELIPMEGIMLGAGLQTL